MADRPISAAARPALLRGSAVAAANRPASLDFVAGRDPADPSEAAADLCDAAAALTWLSEAMDRSTIRSTTVATTPRGPHQSIIVPSVGGSTSWAQRASVITHVWGANDSISPVVPGTRIVTSGMPVPSKSICVRTTRSLLHARGPSGSAGREEAQSATAWTMGRDQPRRISARTCSPIPWTKTTPVVDGSISGRSTAEAGAAVAAPVASGDPGRAAATPVASSDRGVKCIRGSLEQARALLAGVDAHDPSFPMAASASGTGTGTPASFTASSPTSPRRASGSMPVLGGQRATAVRAEPRTAGNGPRGARRTRDAHATAAASSAARRLRYESPEEATNLRPVGAAGAHRPVRIRGRAAVAHLGGLPAKAPCVRDARLRHSVERRVERGDRRPAASPDERPISRRTTHQRSSRRATSATSTVAGTPSAR